MPRQRTLHNLSTEGFFPESRFRRRLTLFFLASVLCHSLLYVGSQHILISLETEFEPVQIRVLELPDLEDYQEVTSARALVSRQTTGNTTGVLRQPFAWELLQEIETHAALKRDTADLLLPEALKNEDAPPDYSHLPMPVVTAPRVVLEKSDATLEVRQQPSPQQKLAERDLSPEPLSPLHEPSVAALPRELAERLDKVTVLAEHTPDMEVAPRQQRSAELRALHTVNASEAPLPDETPVSAKPTKSNAVSAVRKPTPAGLESARWMPSRAGAEVVPPHREQTVKLVVGRLVSLSEAPVHSDHTPVTTSAHNPSSTTGEFVLFISARNEGTAPLLMHHTEGLFYAAAPELRELAGWAETLEDEYTGGDNFSGPRYKDNDKPTYPRIAREREYEGKVVLRVEVLANGQVGKVILQEPSGYQILDRTAIKAVRNWQFHPAKKNGLPADHWTIITIELRLVEG